MKKIILSLMLFSNIALASQSTFIQIIRNHQFPVATPNDNLTRSLIKKAYAKSWSIIRQRYHNIRVKTIYNANGLPDHFILIKNKRFTHGFTLDRINLTANHTLTHNITLSKADITQMAEVSTPHCPDNSITFEISSYDYSDTLRKIFSSQALDEIMDEARQAGFKLALLYDHNATSQQILNYLSCPNLRAAIDKGDGNPENIETANGLLNQSTIVQYLDGKLHNQTIYFNDDSVAANGRDTMKDAIMQCGAQAFLGGKTALSFLTTDEASACFWHQAMQGNNMNTSSSFCQSQYDYDPFVPDGQTGYSSNGNDIFTGVQHPLSQLAWGSVDESQIKGSGYALGTSLNNKLATDAQSASNAYATANKACNAQGGTHCNEHNHYAQFQHCVAAVKGYDKAFYGFNTQYELASRQAWRACNYYSTRCKSIWIGCSTKDGTVGKH